MNVTSTLLEGKPVEFTNQYVAHSGHEPPSEVPLHRHILMVLLNYRESN